MSVLEVVKVNQMGDLDLELVVCVTDLIDWQANHLGLFNLFAGLMTESSLGKDHDYVLVRQPLRYFFN